MAGRLRWVSLDKTRMHNLLIFPYSTVTHLNVCQTVISFENGKLVQHQKWDGKETTIEREIQDGILTAVSL